MATDYDFREEDYCIRSGVPQFWTPGEYGPLSCGCYLVALPFDPHGPCLCLVMQLREGPTHLHELVDFNAVLDSPGGR